MNADDLVAKVQTQGRLHGPGQSRRAVCGVLEALGEALPLWALDLLVAELPDDIRTRLPRRGPGGVRATCRGFLGRVASILYVEPPENAFLARVVLEQLNTSPRVVTPAALAHLAGEDLRPLLLAGHPVPVVARPVLQKRLVFPRMAQQPQDLSA